MSKNIIITCGTSLLLPKFKKSCSDCFNFNKLLDNHKDDIEEIINSEEIDDCVEEYNNFKRKLKEFLKKEYETAKQDNDFSIFMQYGAEFKIILKLNENGDIQIDDRIFLFSSDTLIGKLLTEVIYDILKGDFNFYKLKEQENNYKIIEGNYTIIEGFQTDNPNIFQNKAIKDFFTKLEKIKKNGNKTIMCPVGGYKALIPYSSLYAMVQGWEIKYIYEDSDEIIDLPNGMLSYMLLKAGIKNKNFSDVIKELEKGENSIFSQNVEEFENIVKLIEATNRFVELGDLSGFDGIEFKDEKLKGVNELLKKFVEFDIKIKFGQIRQKDEISNLIKEITTFSEKDILLKPIFNKLQEKFKNFKIGKTDIDFYWSILEFYKNHKMYLQGFLFMREFFIDLVSFLKYNEIKTGKEDRENISKKYGVIDTELWQDLIKDEELEKILVEYIKVLWVGCNNPKNNNKNKKIECIRDIILKFIQDKKDFYEKNNNSKLELEDLLNSKLKNGSIKKEINGMWNELREIRNYFAHCKFSDNNSKSNNKFEPQELESTFKKYYQKLEAFKNYVLNFKND